jgi:hypothetical protein
VNATFPLCVKSTLDYTIKQLANTHELVYVDLDGTFTLEELYASELPALAWSMEAFIEYPRSPQWRLDFLVGGKTTADPAQYTSFELISWITQTFGVNDSIDVKDYSGDLAPTQRVGEIIVTSSGVAHMLTDGRSGLRLVHVQALAVEF